MAQKLIIEEKVRFLALGDSYTIGESVPANDRWPVQLIDSLHIRGIDGYEPTIIATTGWRTDELKKAIVKAKIKGEHSLVSLLIGVNNFYQGKTVESFAPEFEELLNTAIRLAGGKRAHVFVVSIPDYGYTPFGKDNREKITQGIDSFNAACKTIADKLGVKYYDITDISRRGMSEPDLVAGDGLHPSGKMYAEWVTRILNDATLVAEREEETKEE
ncbi:MAG TPA: SGNH/GDSL hydrolase family protein [Chryseolinea sp.]|nr:SGNH/GDSL hydrolase family protein [Chryseolinea sp.]